MKTFTHIVVLLPGIWGAVADREGQQLALSTVKTPYLCQFLSKANRVYTQQYTLCTKLAQLFQRNAPLSCAAVMALAHQLPAQQGAWLLADPVQLQADLSTVYCMGGAHLHVSEQEINKMHQLMSDLLQPDKLTFYTPTARQWFLQCERLPRIETRPSGDMVGRSIAASLPRGPDAPYWQRLMTEIQMLLARADFNQQRQAQGLATINALWLWGQGELPSRTASLWDGVYTDNAFCKGLALLSGSPVQDNQTPHWPVSPAQSANYLICLEILQRLSSAGLWQDWQQQLQQLDETLLSELWQQLQTKVIDAVTFSFLHGDDYQVTRKGIKRFWRRQRTLSSYY